MSKVGRTSGKKLRLKFDTSGIADQDHLYALRDAVMSDDADDINYLSGDSDTEFEKIREDIMEVVQGDSDKCILSL